MDIFIIKINLLCKKRIFPLPSEKNNDFVPQYHFLTQKDVEISHFVDIHTIVKYMIIRQGWLRSLKKLLKKLSANRGQFSSTVQYLTEKVPNSGSLLTSILC